MPLVHPLPPYTHKRALQLADLVDDDTITPQEAERLVGSLLIEQAARRTGRSVPFSRWTWERRRRRLAELGVVTSNLEREAFELMERVDAGELDAEDAERRAGRFLLAEAAVERLRTA